MISWNNGKLIPLLPFEWFKLWVVCWFCPRIHSRSTTGIFANLHEVSQSLSTPTGLFHGWYSPTAEASHICIVHCFPSPCFDWVETFTGAGIIHPLLSLLSGFLLVPMGSNLVCIERSKFLMVSSVPYFRAKKQEQYCGHYNCIWKSGGYTVSSFSTSVTFICMYCVSLYTYWFSNLYLHFHLYMCLIWKYDRVVWVEGYVVSSFPVSVTFICMYCVFLYTMCTTHIDFKLIFICISISV